MFFAPDHDRASVPTRSAFEQDARCVQWRQLRGTLLEASEQGRPSSRVGRDAMQFSVEFHLESTAVEQCPVLDYLLDRRVLTGGHPHALRSGEGDKLLGQDVT